MHIAKTGKLWMKSACLRLRLRRLQGHPRSMYWPTLHVQNKDLLQHKGYCKHWNVINIMCRVHTFIAWIGLTFTMPKKNNEYLFVCLSNLSHKYVRNLISSNLQASVRKNLSINEQMQLEVSSLMFCFLFSSSELILVKRERWVACFQLAICL